MKTAVYARVSTNRQKERQTIASQLRELPEYASRMEWTIVETYVDDGRSGETIEDRPEFQRLLQDAERERFEVLLVIDLDRITRSARSAEGALIYDLLREHRIKIATPAQGVIDLENEDQDLLAGIKRELAKWEKRKILGRMMRGKREAAKQGRRFGSRDPYGYRWVADHSLANKGSYVVVEDEAAIVRRIYAMAGEEGMGVNQIVHALNASGARMRVTTKHPLGNRWARTTVTKLLKTRRYLGAFEVFKHLDEPIKIPLPAVVTHEAWLAANEGMKRRRSDTRWKHDHQYLIANIVRCGVCGRRMWTSPVRQDRAYRSYSY